MTKRKAFEALSVSIFIMFVCVAIFTLTERHIPSARAASQFANIICDSFTPVSTAANVQIIAAGNANMFVYICSYNLNAGATDAFSIVEGTGVVCATGTKAMVGATTAAAGLALANNGTVNFGGGNGAVTKTTVAGNNVCLLVSTAGPLSGVVGWTQAPF